MLSALIVGFVAGAAATPHCLGMCGGFPLHLAKSSRSGSVALRQVLFVLGKTFTYVFLGTLAASLGAVVFGNTRLAAGAPILRLAAGAITLVFGLMMLGLRMPSIRRLQGISDAGFVRSIFSGLFASPSPLAALTLGLGVGFLPCPLPMGMLAVSAASHNVLHAMALMAGVGLGTAPGLLAVGLFGIGLDRRFANTGMRVAGVVVVAIALLTIGKASGLIPRAHPITQAVPSCCEGK